MNERPSTSAALWNQITETKANLRMTELDQKQLGKTLWNIADTLRDATNADDFRDYMLSFLFLRYLSDNYEAAAKKHTCRKGYL